MKRGGGVHAIQLEDERSDSAGPSLNHGAMMPDTKGRMSSERPKGAYALLGAAMAIVGALAAVAPANHVLAALSEAVPQLAATLPPVITACGAILAAMSEPPEVARRK